MYRTRPTAVLNALQRSSGWYQTRLTRFSSQWSTPAQFATRFLTTSSKDDPGSDKNGFLEPNEHHHDHSHDHPSPEEKEKMLEPDLVEMWNHDAPAGPEWGGPREYEPTKHGDWAQRGRVSDF